MDKLTAKTERLTHGRVADGPTSVSRNPTQRCLHIQVPKQRRDRLRPVSIAELGPLPTIPASSALGRESPRRALAGHDADVVHLNRIVRALPLAQPAADAPIANHNLSVVAPLNRPHGAANHAGRVQTLPAGRGHQEPVESRAIEKQPRITVVVRVDTGPHAIAAAGAAVKVDQHQLLALNESLVAKLGRAEH